MKRVLSILLICILTVSLCACSPSPTAVRVNGTAVDASEAAFYLHYNRDAGDLADIKAAALEQIATAELVRQKCKDLKLSLSKEQKDTLKQEKDTLIDQLGGTAAYLDYLESAYLTDRCYDKSQENGLYYQLLYNYMLEKNKDVFTSEYLRQFFASDYLAIQYIAISRLDNDGNPLGETEDSAIIEEYNEDPEMIGLTEPLVLSRAAVKEDYPFLLPAFQLAAGEFDGIYTTDDGYYILIRSAVSANYYAEHQEDIYHTAVNTAFQQAMEDWMKTCKITTTKVFDKMNLDNLAEYVK